MVYCVASCTATADYGYPRPLLSLTQLLNLTHWADIEHGMNKRSSKNDWPKASIIGKAIALRTEASGLNCDRGHHHAYLRCFAIDRDGFQIIDDVSPLSHHTEDYIGIWAIVKETVVSRVDVELARCRVR